MNRIFFAYFWVVLLIDALSKWATVHFITPMYSLTQQYPYDGIGIFRDFLGIEFSINYTTNTGMAWGLFAHYQNFLLILRIILIALMAIYALITIRACPTAKISHIPLMLILAGACGNVMDTFVYGHVIDMFHFVLWGYDFPVFNVADSAIFMGVTSLFLVSLWNPKTDPSLHAS